MFNSIRILLSNYTKVNNEHRLYQYRRYISKCSKSAHARGPPWRVLFFGTDNFSLLSLKALCAKLRTGTLISSLGVVTKVNCTISKFGEAEKLPLYYWPVESADIQSLYDIGMVVSFGNLITKSIINSFPLGCINVHASLLPRWRGAAPIIYSILSGDNESGVTIMKIHPFKFDVGEIVRQYRISISPNETAKDLENRLSLYGSNLLMECLRDLPKCVQMAVPQPETGITYAPKVDQSLSVIDWKKASAQKVFNMYRALSHLYPLRTNWQGQSIKLKNISLDSEIRKPILACSVEPQKSALNFLLDSSSNHQETAAFTPAIDSGTCIFDYKNKLLKVNCADGNKIIVNKLQVTNKVITGLDFYNGYLRKNNKHEWKFEH